LYINQSKKKDNGSQLNTSGVSEYEHVREEFAAEYATSTKSWT
jgi:hypothetical protein